MAAVVIVWPEDDERVYGDMTVLYRIELQGIADKEEEVQLLKNVSSYLWLDGVQVAQQNFLSLMDVGEGRFEGTFGIPPLAEGTHHVSIKATLNAHSSQNLSPAMTEISTPSPIHFESRPLPSCQIAVPGHRKVVRSDRVQVIIHTPRPLLLDDDSAALEVIAQSPGKVQVTKLLQKSPKQTDPTEETEDQGGWRQRGGWILGQLSAAQLKEGPTFVYELDLADVSDGPASVTLLYYPLGQLSSSIQLDYREFFVSRDWNTAGQDTLEEACVRAVGGPRCRGCTVSDVRGGLVQSECDAVAVSQGRSSLLEDDVTRERMAAAAAAPLLHASGGREVGVEGVTVTITSCGRLPLLTDTLRSFLDANTYPLAKIIIVEDSGSAYACAEIRHWLASSLDLSREGGGGPASEVLCHTQRRGQMQALDHLYAHVNTRWVFHLEDDWRFDGTPGFIEDSIDILQDNPNCFQVHLRYRDKSLHPAHAELFHSSIRGAEYRRLVWDQYGWGPYMWHGFSLGPGLRRLSHVRMLGAMAPYHSELHVQDAFQSMGLWAAALEHGVIEHTGDEWSERARWERELQTR